MMSRWVEWPGQQPATHGVLDGRVDHTGPTSTMSWVEVLPQPRLRGTAQTRFLSRHLLSEGRENVSVVVE
jgi:hypothetical protein